MESVERTVQLQDYQAFLLRHRWTLALSVIAGGLFMLLVSLRTTPLYFAEVSLNIEQPSERDVFNWRTAREVASRAWWNYYQTQYVIIRSRQVGRIACAKLGLVRMGPPEEILPQVEAFRANIGVEPVRESRVVKITYTSDDPVRARDAANAVAAAYIEHIREKRAQTQSEALEWLKKTEPLKERAYREATKKLVDFQYENDFVSPDTPLKMAHDRLGEFQQKLTAAEAERIARQAEIEQVETARKTGADPASALAHTGEDPTLLSIEKLIWETEHRKEALLLEGLLEDHPKVVEVRRRIEYLRRSRQEHVDRLIRNIRTRYRMACFKEERFREKLLEQRHTLAELNRKIIDLQQLQEKVAHTKKFYEPFRTKLEQLQVTSGFDPLPTWVIDVADVPSAPFQPNTIRSVILGLLAGFLLGLGLALGIEYVDDSVHSMEDMEAYALLHNAGLIPHIGDRPTGTGSVRGTALISHDQPKAPAVESFRALRTSLLLALDDGSKTSSPICLVTSAAPEEGKTTILLNLAVVLAQSDRRVLAVDADLRRPSLHRVFGIRTEGLTGLLADGREPAEVIVTTEVPNLDVLPAGPRRPNPSELLASEGMKEFLSWARKNYDIVMLDSPPLIAVTDAQVLAPFSDGVLQVVRAHRTSRKLIRRGQAMVAAAHARILGGILNNIDPSSGSYYYPSYYEYYRYSKYYTRSEEEDKERGVSRGEEEDKKKDTSPG